MVAALLEACPALTVLATSRVPLGIVGETRWEVPPLSPAAASQLFHDRAGRISRAWRGDDERAVTEICRKLEGMPLALELAASRVAVLSPGAIARGLDDALDLLTLGRRSLRASLDWSYGLLDAEARRALCALAVFRGGAALEHALELCSLPALETLVEHSLRARRERAFPDAGDRAPVRARAARRPTRATAIATCSWSSPSARGRTSCRRASPRRSPRSTRRRRTSPPRSSARSRPTRRRRCGSASRSTSGSARGRASARPTPRSRAPSPPADPPPALRARALAAWAWIVGSVGRLRARQRAGRRGGAAERRRRCGASSCSPTTASSPIRRRRSSCSSAAGPPTTSTSPRARRRCCAARPGSGRTRRRASRASRRCARGSSGSAIARRWPGSGSSRAPCATRSASTPRPPRCCAARSTWRPRSASRPPIAPRAATSRCSTWPRGGREAGPRGAARDPRPDAAARRQLRAALDQPAGRRRRRRPAATSRPPATRLSTLVELQAWGAAHALAWATRGARRGAAAARRRRRRRPTGARGARTSARARQPVARSQGAAHARPDPSTRGQTP